MMWPRVSLRANTELMIVRGWTIITDRYIQLCLEEHVMLFASFVGENLLLMQDNVRSHTASVTRAYIQEKNTNDLDGATNRKVLSRSEQILQHFRAF